MRFPLPRVCVDTLLNDVGSAELVVRSGHIRWALRKTVWSALTW
jgi:hypothetical protein